MIADKLVERLDGVRSIGDGKWLARCPAHKDGRPSLSIREVEDRVLVHCFAGCDTGAVLDAVNLDAGDLFPPREGVDRGPAARDRSHAHASQAALGRVRRAALYVLVCAEEMARGGALTERDRAKLVEAGAAIEASYEKVGGYERDYSRLKQQLGRS